MTSPIWASALLKTADQLAGRGAGRGRPSLSDLRRSTSTAYYALFHQITRHGALASVPTATENEIAYLARWFTHTGIKQASTWVIKANSGKPSPKADVQPVSLILGGASKPPQQLLSVAEAFVDLQNARHDADYSNDYSPVRYTTLDHLDTAQAAVKDTWSMWRAMESPKEPRRQLFDSYRRFLQLSMLASGGPKTR